MPKDHRAVYWDSCLFVSYIEDTPGRGPTLGSLLARSNPDGDIQIYTSTLSHVEVAFSESERGSGQLDALIEGRIDTLWTDPKAIVSVEFIDIIGKLARDLMRRGIPLGWSLKPLDAVHLATAQWFI